MSSDAKMRILVVDDDRLIRWSLQSALSSEGYDVTTLDSAEQALAQLETNRFDLAIVDVMLPQMDGLELVERMRSVCPGIKTLVITGQRSGDTERRVLEQGALAYVEKPFSVKELSGLVKQALPSPGMAQA